jgi:hypothetical protein
MQWMFQFRFKFTNLPIVLVHGIWESSKDTWIVTNFKKTLENNSFKVYFADYTSHYSETFYPYKTPKIGNHGIDSINKIISTILQLIVTNR